MAGMRELFKTDEHGESEGVIFQYDTFRVRCARAGGQNKRYTRVLERETKPIKRAIQSEMLSDDQARNLMKKVFAEAVVLDWETLVDGEWQQGIEGPDGSLLPFTKENVIAVFDELPDLFDELQDRASKAATYRASLLEEDGKN